MQLIISDRIRERKLTFFNRFQLNLPFDSVGGTFSFEYYFNPENEEHKELSCVGHYHLAKVTHNGETLLTGVILSITFKDAPVNQLVAISGYSLPGVLEDCDIPTGLYPLQSDGLSLKQITERLIKPFGLKLKISDLVYKKSQSVIVSNTSHEAESKGYVKDVSQWSNEATTGDQKVNGEIKTSTAPESKNIKSYLQELAVTRNIILSHDEDGNLLFTKANTAQEPVAHFTRDMPNTTMQLTFNGQAMHSHITVIQQANDEGGDAGEVTLRNPFVINSVFRPKVIVQSSGADVDAITACKNAIADELKNLSVVITIDRWILDSKIIKPNSMITVKNSRIYLYKASKWFIESVSYSGDEKQTVATLTCKLPCVYDGSQPDYLFKKINLH